MKSFKNKIIASFLLIMFAFAVNTAATAQDTKFRDQSWRYGLMGAAQYNAASLGWQTLHEGNDNFHSEPDDIDRVDGSGWGTYAGISASYLSESWWGIQMRISYDERNALIDDITRSPVPSFDTRMNYLSFAPSFRVDQNFIPNLNFHVGPFVDVNLTGSYYYKADRDQENAEKKLYDITDLNIATYGIQGGIGYDIKIAHINNRNAMYLTPFFDMSWLVNQRKSEGMPSQNSITDIWSTLSYRVGLMISLDYKQYTAQEDKYGSHEPPAIPERQFTTNKVEVEMPINNVISTKNVRGYFPILPYVFFEKGSQEIPPRYTLLSEAEARNFKESDLEDFMEGDLTSKETNIDQLMRAYYNVLNIFGDRMRKNPNEDLMLRGSDPEESDAQASAAAVKKYLVENFGIDPDRITIETDPPFTPSGSIYTEEASQRLIDNENRRVKFVFNNPEMTKPIEYTIRDESSIDNDMFFTIDRGVAFKSWDITITGEGRTMYFGPYSYRYARINPSELMRFLETGRYNAEVEITDKNGNKTEENVAFMLTKSKEIKNAARYLMLFDYNSNDAIKKYDDKIREEIVPSIESGSKVIVHGHTDNIGSVKGNKELSQERANDVKKLIDDQLTIENRSADIEAIGVGEIKVQYSFNNRYPEGRMYNRNVFVEIIK